MYVCMYIDIHMIFLYIDIHMSFLRASHTPHDTQMYDCACVSFFLTPLSLLLRAER
jgi:hypothetical protein